MTGRVAEKRNTVTWRQSAMCRARQATVSVSCWQPRTTRRPLTTPACTALPVTSSMSAYLQCVCTCTLQLDSARSVTSPPCTSAAPSVVNAADCCATSVCRTSGGYTRWPWCSLGDDSSGGCTADDRWRTIHSSATAKGTAADDALKNGVSEDRSVTSLRSSGGSIASLSLTRSRCSSSSTAALCAKRRKERRLNSWASREREEEGGGDGEEGEEVVGKVGRWGGLEEEVERGEEGVRGEWAECGERGRVRSCTCL